MLLLILVFFVQYNGPAASDATSGTCDRFIPFRGVAKHAPFTSWDQCMGDCNGVPHDPTDGGFCAPSLVCVLDIAILKLFSV
mgnify:CR=1 FL=1